MKDNMLGGEQDKQMTELINVVRKDSHHKNIHFVAFLDGVYSNSLLMDIFLPQNNNKISKQQQDIMEALNLNKSNLWLNSSGFRELLKDLN